MPDKMTVKKLRLNLTIEWDGERWCCGDNRTGLYGVGLTEEEAIGDYLLAALQYRELATKNRPLVTEQEQPVRICSACSYQGDPPDYRCLADFDCDRKKEQPK